MTQVQLVVVQDRTTSIWLEGRPKAGDVVWVSEAAARHLLEHGICRMHEPDEAKPAGPAEVEAAGPGESKPAGPSHRKSAGEAPDGRSTASPSSSEPGREPLSSASAAALVLPHRL